MPILGIVENSGAIITDWNGGTNFEDGNVLVSPNRNVHDNFLKMLKS